VIGLPEGEISAVFAVGHEIIGAAKVAQRLGI